MPYGNIPANQAGMLVPGRNAMADSEFGHTVYPTLQGSFRDQADVGSSADTDYDSVGYRFDQSGFVYLMGQVNAALYTTGLTSGGTGTLLFTIAETQLRPVSTCAWAVCADNTSGTLIVRINPDGTVYIVATGVTTGLSRISLDGCSWWVGRSNVLAVAPELAMSTMGAVPAPTYVTQNQANEIVGTSVVQNPWVASGTITPHSIFGGFRHGIIGALTGPASPTIANSPAWNTSDDNFSPNPDFVTDHRLIYAVAGVTSGTPWVDRADLMINASLVPELLPQRPITSTSIMYLQGVQGANAPGTSFWGPPLTTWGSRPANQNMWGNSDYASGFDGWYDATLTAPWNNYLNGYRKVQYARDWFGNIHLRGLVKDGLAGTVIAVLPTGWHGPFRSANPVWTSQGLSKILLSTSGAFSISGSTQYVGGTGHWVSLNGVIFRG